MEHVDSLVSSHGMERLAPVTEEDGAALTLAQLKCLSTEDLARIAAYNARKRPITSRRL